MSAGTPDLDAEIKRLTEEIAARRAEATRIREGLDAHRGALGQVGIPPAPREAQPPAETTDQPPPGEDAYGAPATELTDEPPPAEPTAEVAPAAPPADLPDAADVPDAEFAIDGRPAETPEGPSPAPTAAEMGPPRLPAQRELLDRGEIADVLREVVPEGGIVLVPWSGYDVVSEMGVGDVHRFPAPVAPGEQAHAEGGTAAIASLEAMRAKGATHFVLPADRQEWLASTPGFMAYVMDRYRKVAHHGEWSVWGLGFDDSDRRPGSQLQDVFELHRARFGGELAALDWDSGLELVGRQQVLRGLTAFKPIAHGESLPYLSASVEMVAVPRKATPGMLAEARRVASNVVIQPAHPPGPNRYFEVEWLREPVRSRPPVSIIVPTYDAAGILDTCLRALHETSSPALEVEAVVVDDASSDDTQSLLEGWTERIDWLQVVRNADNEGFLASCNAGAEAASGELLVFLNNDTIPLAGWLLPLVETLVDEPAVGAVGGKLLYPNGVLQEAGAMIFSDGSGANFGRGDANPDASLYGFLREVHYCSGALLATPAELFRALGGFDLEFSPGYYEETDYCFRVRREGLRVLYEPESAIVHLEGATAGTDGASGMKRYQAINREKFRQRWADVLADCPPPPMQWDELIWHRLPRRGLPVVAAAQGESP